MLMILAPDLLGHVKDGVVAGFPHHLLALPETQMELIHSGLAALGLDDHQGEPGKAVLGEDLELQVHGEVLEVGVYLEDPPDAFPNDGEECSLVSMLLTFLWL
jgi:hypothetical protein